MDNHSGQKIIDYNIHDLAGIRLFNPSDGDALAVARQLGPLQAPLKGEPDILIHFVEKLPIKDLRYLGLNSVGYNEEGFFILRSSKKNAKVRISFDEIGKKVQIWCESGLKSVPLLLAIVNLTLLSKNVVGVHASAFVYNGLGILVTGWAKGGKTEALLSFANHGSEYVGDEWIFLSTDGAKMFGIPENIRLWDWHFDGLPHLKPKLSREKRLLFKWIHTIDRIQRRLPDAKIFRALPFKFLREAMPALRRQLNVQLPPGKIFARCCPTYSATCDKIFLMASQENSDYSVEAMDAQDIAKRMAASFQFELRPFLECYLAYKFAFPEKANHFIEQAPELQTDLLKQAFSGKDAFLVKHPYPVNFDQLYATMQPYCEKAEEIQDVKRFKEYAE